MENMELEVKILDIDKDKFIEKLNSLGAKIKSDSKQFLYTYDLPTIYGRYIDLITQLNDPESNIKYETSMSKLKLLFFEIDNFLNDVDKKELERIIGFNNLQIICMKDNLLNILNKQELINFIKKFHNNSKKWIRVRQTNDKATIAVKHILADVDSNLQQMLETEITVENVDEANKLLSALGFAHKSYQEKERLTYILDEHEIDIDSWPGIPTYVEIEGKSEEEIGIILNKLGYTLDDTISCTADQVYQKYGKTMFEKRELKFEDYK